MTRFLLGLAAGVSLFWAALAVWQRVPGIPDIEPDDVPSGRPAYRDAVLRSRESGAEL